MELQHDGDDVAGQRGCAQGIRGAKESEKGLGMHKSRLGIARSCQSPSECVGRETGKCENIIPGWLL